ncbi:MAG: ABC transporter ATP-binding protein [Nitrospirae bacterium]|nr:MAG: ABC transporter ATP-binding protein [Nitrospirota bacterium]
MIEIVNLSMRLTGGGEEVSILDDITLTIPAKQFVAIVGPSGSGKSTLLGLIAGLDAPSAGAIILDGLELGSLSEDELARMRLHTLGYVFQSFHLIPTLTALENVAVPLELAESPDVRSKAEALLHAVGLGERARHYPIQLSGGEQQRVAVARAFANRPPVLLADEPTGNLDTVTGRQVVELIIRLNRDHGSTLVLVTHDPILASHADRVVTLMDGRIASDELRMPDS